VSGAFEEGTVLWYWYDWWIAAPVLILSAVAAHQVVRNIPWSRPIPLLYKSIALIGTLSVAIVVLDRVGFYIAIEDPQTFGYASMIGAGLTLAAGLVNSAFATGRRLLLRANTPALDDLDDETHKSSDEPPGTTSDPVQQTVLWHDAKNRTDAKNIAIQSTLEPAPNLTAPEGEDSLAMEDPSDETSSTPVTEKPVETPAGRPEEHPSTANPANRVDELGVRLPSLIWLEVKSGPDRGQAFSLVGLVTTVGRSKQNTITLSDPSVSHLQARIVREGDDFIVEDCWSDAGTLLDGAWIPRSKLRPGAVLRMGETELIVRG